MGSVGSKLTILLEWSTLLLNVSEVDQWRGWKADITVCGVWAMKLNNGWHFEVIC